MIQDKPLTIIDITHELNSGISTIKFILNRFSPWLPFEPVDGQQCYSRNTIPLLIKIKESLEAGMLPSEIDQELKTNAQKNAGTDHNTTLNPHFMEQPNEDIRVSKDGLSLIKSLFDDIAIQQSRVATAHEKRAVAEERKAIAIEKRADAEEKKAVAMNNIASALQEMNRHRLPDPQTREMARKAAQFFTQDEINPDMSLPELGDTAQQDYSEMFDSQDPSVDLLVESDIDVDDLNDLIEDTLLVDVENISEKHLPEEMESSLKTKLKLDDLSALIDPEIPRANGPNKDETNKDEVLELDDLSTLLDDPAHPDEMDDLSALIDTVSAQAVTETMILDDLSLLIDETASQGAPQELDNLSSLIDETASQGAPQELDNLSLLIDETASQGAPQELDNLSLLIDETASQGTPQKQDNLSLLITPDSVPISQVPMDDLSALIEKTPSLKPDITPEENLKKYKAAVMKTILQLKTDGVSPKEATLRLNEDGVQTISGKSKWSEIAISQIYKFIDSAK